jgi:conjugative relaxase-like TrwC/TraI family protein
VLRIKSGHSVRYYTDATTEARENYYTGEAAAGEPPGRWSGAGAERLGLRGLVDPKVMIGVYERVLDPRDARFGDESQWDAMSDDGGLLGHNGYAYRTETQVYQSMLAAEPTADAARRDTLRILAGQQARKNVSFHDATFSMPKSVSVAHAAFARQEVTARRAGDLEGAEAWGTLRRAVEEAMWAGNTAAMDYLAEHAGYSRTKHHGGQGGQWIDAHDLTIASFFQHDSRDGDPHLHIHNVIHNRVLCADGVWRTLDGKAMRAFKGAAAAVGERTAEAHLYATLGVLAETRPDGKARELVGVDQDVCALLSSRRRAIAPRAVELIEAFEARHGREASPLERDRLAHQAMITTRRSKTRHETIEERLDRVEAQIAADLGTGLGQVANEILVMAGAERAVPAQWSPAEVIETALAAVQANKAGYTRSDLTREISDTLPANLGITEGAEIAALLDYLTDEALKLAVALDVAKPGDMAVADQFRLANGTSAFIGPGRARYATPVHIQTERLLVEAARRRDGRAASTTSARAFVDRLAESGIELGADQREALIGVLTSGGQLESLVGPAGTGKSFVLGMLNRAWSDPDTWADQPGAGAGRVVGLATSEQAATVLRAEGLAAANTAAWLAAQTRIAENRALDTDARWVIGAGDLVVIDESSMSDTAAVAAVHARVEAAGASLLLVGDHRQAGAVGAGGIGKLLAERGRAYELTEARRFTHAWERTASLRLRAGDVSCLGDYHREGRILDGGTLATAEAAAQRGWLADHLAGRRCALVVDTNEQAGRLNAAVRAQLVALGLVAEHGVPLGLEGTTAGVGDIVQGRRLAWDLAGYAGNRRGPINRELYRVEEICDNGDLVVVSLAVPHTATDTGTGTAVDGQVGADRLTLPAAYVAEDLSLGYAGTVHAFQGLTVDTGHDVITPSTPAHLAYPALTRGRHANHAYVVTRAADEDAAPGEVAGAVTRDPRAVLATILETDRTDRSATEHAADSLAEAVSARTAAERLGAVAEVVVAERTTMWLDELTATGELSFAQRRRLAAEDGTGKLAPVLRQVEMAGQDPRAALAAAIRGAGETGRGLDDARQVSNVLVHRLTQNRSLDPVGDRFAAWAPATTDPALAATLAQITEAGDARRHDLGETLAVDPPVWADELLGPVPDQDTDPAARAEWVARAGTIAAHREIAGLTEEPADPAELLGLAPKPGQIEAYASWRAAWRASGQPDIDRDERQMSNGQLRMRVRAWEREQVWAPRRVDNELAGTIQAAEHHRATAELRTAAASAATDPAERDRLLQEAREASALAETLEADIPRLRQLDDVYYAWRAHTAGTRAGHDRAKAELGARGEPLTGEDHLFTAAELLAADRAARQAEDPHREITEHDLAEHDLAEHDLTDPALTEEPAADNPDAADDLGGHTDDADDHDAGNERVDVRGGAQPVRRAEADRAKEQVVPRDLLDLRELAAEDPDPADEDTVRAPSAEEMSDSTRRAVRSLEEMRARNAADAERDAADEQAHTSRVQYWRTRDEHTSAESADDAAELV